MRRVAHSDYGAAVLAGLLALALYVRTLAPGVLAGDSGEFQFAAWLAGIVHPTGYPLYLILGYLWTHLLPWGDPAWRLNLLSAIFAALAVGLVYVLALRSLCLAGPVNQPDATYRLLAAVAAATFAVTPTFWSQAVVAEVYALHAVFVAGLFLTLVSWASDPARDRLLYLAAAVCGLGLTHHRAIILLIPGSLLFIARVAAQPGNRRPWWPRIWRALACLLVPLLLYIYIPLRAPHTPYLTIALSPGQVLHLYQAGLGGFVRYVTGEGFAGALRSIPGAAAQVRPAWGLFWRELSWAGFALGVAGVAWLTRQRGRALLMLTGVSFFCVVVFNLFYGIGDVYVYYIPAYLIWCLWLALGVGGLGAALARLAGRLRGVPPVVQARLPASPGIVRAAALLALVLAAWLLAANFARADQSTTRAAVANWDALLAQPIPRGAVLVTNDRDEMMPLWYAQQVQGVRPDLAGLFPLILPDPEWQDVGQVTEQALASGRPVYLIKPMPGLEVKLRLEQDGPLVRVLGPAVTRLPQHTSTAVFADEVRLAGYDLQAAQLEPGGTVDLTLYWQPLRQLAHNYTSFIHLVNAEGAVIGQSDHRPGGVYYPSSLWEPGEFLRDAHAIRLADQPLGTPPYTIRAGLYNRTPAVHNLGEPQDIGRLP